jgi:hypothetical protein
VSFREAFDTGRRPACRRGARADLCAFISFLAFISFPADTTLPRPLTAGLAAAAALRDHPDLVKQHFEAGAVDRRRCIRRRGHGAWGRATGSVHDIAFSHPDAVTIELRHWHSASPRPCTTMPAPSLTSRMESNQECFIQRLSLSDPGVARVELSGGGNEAEVVPVCVVGNHGSEHGDDVDVPPKGRGRQRGSGGSLPESRFGAPLGPLVEQRDLSFQRGSPSRTITVSRPVLAARVLLIECGVEVRRRWCGRADLG